MFLQMACDEALADRLRLRGRLDISELLAHSRRWRTSIWRTLGVTVGRAVWPGPKRFSPPAYLVDRTETGSPPHPWLEDLRGLPAAKAVQIDALVASQNVFGSSRRGCAVSCLHPLLSQPVVELTLSLPSFLLTQGGAGQSSRSRRLRRLAPADPARPALEGIAPGLLRPRGGGEPGTSSGRGCWMASWRVKGCCGSIAWSRCWIPTS